MTRMRNFFLFFSVFSRVIRHQRAHAPSLPRGSSRHSTWQIELSLGAEPTTTGRRRRTGFRHFGAECGVVQGEYTLYITLGFCRGMQTGTGKVREWSKKIGISTPRKVKSRRKPLFRKQAVEASECRSMRPSRACHQGMNLVRTTCFCDTW